jgi:uncharacterized protein (TIRG00374 family)
MSSTVSPARTDGPAPDRREHDDELHLSVTGRKLLAFLVFVLLALAFLYFVVPQVAGLDETWHRIDTGDPWWLAAALAFTILSFGGYVLLFQSVFVRAGSPIDLRASYQITMAGLAATRILAAGGAGGVVLTAWALRRSGMPPRIVADQTLAFLVLTYAVYMATIVLTGLALYLGLLAGPAPFGLTLVPALLAAAAIGLTLALAAIPPDLQRRLEGYAGGHGRVARLTQRAANAPAAFSAGVREALHHLRSRDPALLGSIAFWAFNVAVLWASFRAFGDAPPSGVIIMAYFIGMLGNLLPLPGGVGGVDGGMIASFLAFGVDSSLAFVAVLTYRAFAFWLPTIPGAIAYFQLRKTVSRWGTRRETSAVGASA